MRYRFRLTALIAAAGLVLIGLGGNAAAARSSTRALRSWQSVLTPAQVSQLAAHATDREIIIYKNQLASLPARGASARRRVSAAAAAQAPVMAELTQLHATHVDAFHIINAIAATISPAEIQHLRTNPAVQAVVPDSPVQLAPIASVPGPLVPGGIVRHRHRHGATGDPAQQVCPSNPVQPLIEPEGRTLIDADAANKIVDGSGIKVALLYDGVDVNNPDLIRPDGQHVIFDYQDFSGQGPTGPTSGFANYMAGVVAAQGNETYDLSNYVNPAHPLPAGCNIKIEGIAPGVSMAELNWGGDDAAVYNSNIIQTIQYAVMVDHVNVLDEPFGGPAVPNTQNDPPTLANQAAVAAGVVVVSLTGDTGNSDGDIFSPGGTPGVIGVGATTSFQSYVQTDQNGPNLGTGGWEDNNISADSTTGINDSGPRTMDVVAPGDAGWGLCDTDTTRFFACTDPLNGSSPGITQLTSTAVSSSEVTGVAALVMQAYAKTHDGQMPSAPLVEQIIVSTATDLGAPADHQGAGLVNALKAVQLAESINSTSPQGRTLLVNQAQLGATLNAGQTHKFSVAVTNEAGVPQTVTPTVSGRPTTVSTDSGTITLGSSSPTYVDGSGNTDSYAVHTFTVPAGTDYMNGDITWNAQQVGGAAFEELFDPQGNLAAYSILDGNQSGFGHVEVRQPMAGTWTAVIYTASNAQYFGPVQYSYSTEDFNTAGSVSPASRRLAPGQSGTFQVTVTAGQPGDEALSLHMGTGSSTDGAIPILLRALVPITGGGGSFAGTFTGDGVPGTLGGAGNPGTYTAGGGQQLSYFFNVPAGEPSLNIGIKLRDSDYILEGSLVDPNGEGLDLQSTANDAIAPGGTMQFFHRAPQPGQWSVSLVTTGAVDGTHLSEPFTGTISFTPPTVTSSGLPDSAGTVLPAGQPATATITVTNTGNATKDFFADPRLNGQVPLELLGSTVPNGQPTTETMTVPEPLPGGITPHWVVPPDTSELIGVAQATLPITFDMNSDDNDPEELGLSIGDDSVATLVTPEVAPGQEWAAPVPTCPCAAPVSGTTTLTGVAITNPFATGISSSTGDVWAQTVNASAPYSPLTLAPGQSGTITLTITPSAPNGTVVSGFIAVDTYNSATFSGDELINIPYTYTVG
jgi:Peptidase inhibitor I9